MTVVRYPTLRLSANGARALLDTAGRGFGVFDVPGLGLRFGRDSFENVHDVTLSSSGTSVAVRTSRDELLVVSGSGQRVFSLPYTRERVPSVAISDAADKVALLVGSEVGGPDGSAEVNGSLEIWSLPPGRGPLASASLPLYGYGAVAANATASRLSVYTSTRLSNAQYTAVYDYAPAIGKLTQLWAEKGPPLSRIRATLGGDWVWAVQADGLVGWRRGETPVQLPGTLRDRLVFSPTFSHLLAYRGEAAPEDASIPATSVLMLFRLFDLSTLKESRRVSHVIDSYSDAHFALSGDLALFELRATRDGEPVAKELGW